MTAQAVFRVLSTLALTAGLVAIAPPTAGAPLEAKQKQAEALEDRIREQGSRLSAAGEDYNEARVERERLAAQADSAKSLVVSAEQEWAALRSQLGRRARLLYMHPGAALDAFFGAESLGDMARARVYGGEVLLTDTKLVMQAEMARREVLEQAQALDKLRADAARKEDELDARRSQVERELGAQRSLLRGVKGDIAEIIAADHAREIAAAQAAAQSAPKPADGTAPSGPPASKLVDEPEASGPAPAARASASKAVQTARAQLGKPYEWGAAGPGSFDCSGLTMYAWRSAGVSLPHSSRAQYSSLPHVARSQIQPGDLIFYGNPIHHVGIYEGGGTMINAPETGENVRRDSINRSDYVGAARP